MINPAEQVVNAKIGKIGKVAEMQLLGTMDRIGFFGVVVRLSRMNVMGEMPRKDRKRIGSVHEVEGCLFPLGVLESWSGSLAIPQQQE